MNSTWQKQVSRRAALAYKNPDYYVSWVVSNVPKYDWLTASVTARAPDSVYTDLSMRLGEMGLS